MTATATLPASAATAVEPTAEQIAAYRRDGFLVVQDYMPRDELVRVREHFSRVFGHDWETGLAPDEVNYTPGITEPDRTRQLCNVWKADRTLARTTLSRRNGCFAAALAGAPGMRLLQDNAIWKPPSGKALLAHQDAAYTGWLSPKNMTTCWIALDDTAADRGTIYYVRGSHLWPHAPAGGQFHAPDDWLGYLREVVPAGTEIETMPIEVPAGGAAFHDGWTWHGSPPNERPDAERRSIISHLVTSDTVWSESGETHPLYSRYRRPGERELDEAFFPVVWRSDREPTSLIDEVYAPGGS
jgi:ectoine hydroxylase-related dioxygenase (phytanoyl-CoA dioxygenase family)